jgi:hypothetical protein
MILHNRDPYRSSRIDIAAQQLVEGSGISPRDFLLIDPYSIGDVYHTLTLIGEFRKRHCAPDQKIHLMCNIRCVPIAKLFANVEKCIGMNCGPFEFHLETFAQRYSLAPGFPIVLQPDMYGRGWLGRLMHAGKITIIEAKKLLLDLDLDAPLATPKLNEALRTEAYAKARAQGLTSDSVIIFNHAQSVESIDPDIFKVLLPYFGKNVYYDATIKDQGIVPWAKPLQIELAHIPFFAELAKNVVAVRSGIVDILSAVDCNLITLYPNASLVKKFFTDPASIAKAMRNFTLRNLNLRPQAPEYAIFLEEGDAAGEIAQKLDATLESLSQTGSIRKMAPEPTSKNQWQKILTLGS